MLREMMRQHRVDYDRATVGLLSDRLTRAAIVGAEQVGDLQTALHNTFMTLTDRMMPYAGLHQATSSMDVDTVAKLRRLYLAKFGTSGLEDGELERWQAELEQADR